ncbi:MAG: type II toxin-antitoxin system HicB family antitoxin [Dehalococcoidia bacterium]|nr:type II toxin-antitoxin system HicB family antitoxin [Dehalococcoidia bacterium]
MHESQVPPFLPGIATEGETTAEAISIAKQAIAMHSEGLMAHGLAAPEEDTNAQVLIVGVAAWTQRSNLTRAGP